MAKVNFFLLGRSQLKVKDIGQIFFISGKLLSQGTYMSNMKALSENIKSVNFFLLSMS